MQSAVNEGRAEYMPVFLGEIPKLFESGEILLMFVSYKFPHQTLMAIAVMVSQ